jgi:hypothetical protein
VVGLTDDFESISIAVKCIQSLAHLLNTNLWLSESFMVRLGEEMLEVEILYFSVSCFLRRKGFYQNNFVSQLLNSRSNIPNLKHLKFYSCFHQILLLDLTLSQSPNLQPICLDLFLYFLTLYARKVGSWDHLAVCVSLRKFQLLNQLIYFRKTCYERYITGHHLNLVLFTRNFLELTKFANMTDALIHSRGRPLDTRILTLRSWNYVC